VTVFEFCDGICQAAPRKIDRSLLLRHFAGEKTARMDPQRIRVFINDALGITKTDSAVLLVVRKSAWECYRQLKGFTKSAVRKGCPTSEYIVKYITVIVRSAQVNVSSYVPSASIRR
jgi:hypothetical protein